MQQSGIIEVGQGAHFAFVMIILIAGAMITI
jgi:hypothetical protein